MGALIALQRLALPVADGGGGLHDSTGARILGKVSSPLKHPITLPIHPAIVLPTSNDR